ncbi:hypothetical protein BH09MYX1_BH09MYX1_50920 [soil metagenome]
MTDEEDEQTRRHPVSVRSGPFSIGSVLQGRYRIEGTLGTGGMSIVYIARHEAVNRNVAIKVPTNVGSPRERARFLREGRAAAAVQHPNVCRVFDLGDHDGQPFLVMEYLDGTSLLDWMIDSTTTDADDAVAIALQILGGLSAAHAVGFLHRDVKPANVILSGEPPRVKLLDFGLAKPIAQRPNDVNLTATGITVGTRPYMSPEQLRGKRDLDVRCDVYSAGALLFHMLAGKLPFGGDGISLALAITSGSHLDLGDLNPELPHGLIAAVHRAIRVNREERFSSAAVFADALRSAMKPLESADTDVVGDAGMKRLIAIAEEAARNRRRPQ